MRRLLVIGFQSLCVLALGAGVANHAAAQAKPDGTQATQEATDEEARVHFRLGVAYHDSGRFQQAAEEFEQAYALSKRSQLLYNLFLAHRDAGNLHRAAEALKLYLELEQEVREREKLEARLAALERMIEGQPRPEDKVTEPEPEAVAEPVAEKTAEMERNPWHKYTPWAMIGGGGAMLATGFALGAMAKSDESKLDSECPGNTCPPGFDPKPLQDSGSTKALVSDIMTFGGAAVAGVGLALYFILPREREVQMATTGDLICGRGGCAAQLTHRF